MAKQRHLRHGDHLEEDDTVVVRGGELDPESLRFDAERYHALLLFLLLCGALQGCTGWHDRRRLSDESPAQGHYRVRIGTGGEADRKPHNPKVAGSNPAPATNL
jgi:hypothetical protein